MTDAPAATDRVGARLHHLVLDCADPQADARFWSALLGQPITYDDGDFVVVAGSDRHSGRAFQTAATRVLGLGATHLGEDVCADPAGHPFCLVTRPGWAPPLDA